MRRAVKLSIIVLVVIVFIIAVGYIISPKTQLKYAIINSTEATSCAVTYEQDLLSLNCELKSPELSLETVCNIKDSINRNYNFGAMNKIQKVRIYITLEGKSAPLTTAVLTRKNSSFSIERISFYRVVNSSELAEFDLSEVESIIFNWGIDMGYPDDFSNLNSLIYLRFNTEYSSLNSNDINQIRKLLPKCYIYFTDETLCPISEQQ